MWQLHGFGEIGTPERRIAILDQRGAIQWTGDSVQAAVQFIAANDLIQVMERDSDGMGFVRECEEPAPTWPADRHALPGRSAPR